MDTDSLYSEWGSLLDTIEGVENMTHEQKLDIVLKINQQFLDKHNCEYIKEYYDQRHANSVHEFELETVGYGGFWMNVKKRYAQLLAFKDGKYYDTGKFPLKIKGLEIIKSSTPKLAREELTNLVTYFLELPLDSNLIFKMNLRMQEMWKKWQEADVESISESIKINTYTKYVLKDTDGLEFAKGAQGHYKGCGYYNYLINKYKVEGSPITSGKVKVYQVDVKKTKGLQDVQEYFVFGAKNWKPWMEKYAPIDRKKMFQKNVLDAFNRILEALMLPELKIDGSIQGTLF